MSYIVKRFANVTNPAVLKDPNTWQSYFDDKKLIKPLYPYRYENFKVADLKFSLRTDGIDELTFTSFLPELSTDLSLGSIYTVHLTDELDDPLTEKILPATFILTKTEKLFNFELNEAADICQGINCTGMSINDLLSRKWLNCRYRNIRLKDLLINLLNKTREVVPQLNPDTSLIEDVDYTYLNYYESKKFLGEVIEDIRDLGFVCYLDSKLRLVLTENLENNIKLNIDILRETVNDVFVVQQDSRVDEEYSAAPITRLIVKGGSKADGDSFEKQIVGTGSATTGSVFPLDAEINTEDNFILESFDSLALQNFTSSNLPGNGWNYRYAIYDDPIESGHPSELQIKCQIINSAERSYVLGIHSGNAYNPLELFFGLMIDGDKLKCVCNGIFEEIGVLKPALEKTVIGKTFDNKSFTLNNVDGLEVGDHISLGGISSSLTVADAVITEINGLVITISTPASDGTIDGVILRRIVNYIFKVVSFGNTVKAWLKEEAKPFEFLGVWTIQIPENFFVTPFNNQNGAVAIVGNGVYEVGNLALDYFFIDKGKYIHVLDQNGDKVSTCEAGQSDTVVADIIVNKVTQNDSDFSQIEFLLPSWSPTVLDNSGTTSRIPLAFSEDAFVREGMRVLFEGKEYFITSYFVDLGTDLSYPAPGWIEVSPNLPAPPARGTPVLINTSVPEIDKVYTIKYIKAKALVLKECASAISGVCSNFGYRDYIVEVAEIGKVADLQKYARDFMIEQCSPSFRGQVRFIMSDQDCPLSGCLPFLELPVPGEFVKVSDARKSIFDQKLSVQMIDYSVSPALRSSTNYVEILIDFGLPKSDNTQITSKLIKRLGFHKGDDVEDKDVTLEMPCTLRDEVDVIDSLTVSESAGYPFWVGGYKINVLGGKEYVEPTEQITVAESQGYSFWLGGYSINVLGATV